MGRKKGKRDLEDKIIRKTTLFIGEEFDEDEARDIFEDQIREEVNDSIKGYLNQGKSLDISIQAVMGLYNREIETALWRKEKNSFKDCEYSMNCTAPVKSAQYCCTRNHVKCPYKHKQTEKNPKYYSFHLNAI